MQQRRAHMWRAHVEPGPRISDARTDSRVGLTLTRERTVCTHLKPTHLISTQLNAPARGRSGRTGRPQRAASPSCMRRGWCACRQATRRPAPHRHGSKTSDRHQPHSVAANEQQQQPSSSSSERCKQCSSRAAEQQQAVGFSAWPEAVHTSGKSFERASWSHARAHIGRSEVRRCSRAEQRRSPRLGARWGAS